MIQRWLPQILHAYANSSILILHSYACRNCESEENAVLVFDNVLKKYRSFSVQNSFTIQDLFVPTSGTKTKLYYSLLQQTAFSGLENLWEMLQPDYIVATPNQSVNSL